MKIRLLLCIMSLVAFATTGCVFPKAYNLPPAQQLLEPGPGVGGPGPGVIPANAMGAMGGGGPPMIPVTMPTVQLLFAKPEGMQVRWDVSGHRMFDSSPLVVPGRQNFPQDGIYRLKITNVAGREGVELYPTVEIAPTTPRSEAFLAHNAIPVQFTEEDFDQVLAGNFVTKVIYLPDPEFQELALAGVETLVSTRLDPGVDPIAEADRRGAILAVIRLGNKDIEMPGSIEGPEFGAMGGGFGGAMYCGPGGHPAFPPSLPPNYVAGVTAPQYGMTQSGTPIGLPGPPHIPLGGPAGLQTHTMKNHTHYHIPGPTEHFKVHVRQQPGFNYPKPVNRVHIREQNIHAAYQFGQPHYDKHERISGGGPGSGAYYNDAHTPYGAPGYCPPGQ